MGLVQRISNLSGIPQHLFQRQGSSLEPLSQRFTFEVFHHQEIGVVLLTDVVKRADMRMVQAGNGARLPHNSFMYFRAIGKISSQYRDGYKALQPSICSLVDLAHAAFAQERQDLIRPQLGTVHQYVRLAVGKSEKTIARLVVSGEQRFHLASHGLLHANLIHVLVPLVRRSFQGACEHRLHPLPLLGSHAFVSLFFISRCSQARAVAHSRFTVAGETPSTTEVSSMESPPKNRSSTTRLCCRSKTASWFKASSRATRFTSRAFGRATSGSRVSRGAPAPRLAAARFRAWSTRMCRINCAATPKK